MDENASQIWKLVADVNYLDFGFKMCFVMTYLHMGRLNLKNQAKLNGGTTQES